MGLRELEEAAEPSKSSFFHVSRARPAVVRSRVLERVDLAVQPALEDDVDLAVRLLALLDLLVEQPTSSRLLVRALSEDDDLPEEGLLEADQMNTGLARLLGNVPGLTEHGIQAGRFRPVSPAHTVQTLIGFTVFHFASGDFGAELLRQPILSAASIAERRREVADFVRYGLIVQDAPEPQKEKSQS